MKTRDEYVQENKILHYLHAEAIDLDDDRVDNLWAYWERYDDQEQLNRVLRGFCIEVLTANGKHTEAEAEVHLNHIVQDKIAEARS
jgi:hypothetical protein